MLRPEVWIWADGFQFVSGKRLSARARIYAELAEVFESRGFDIMVSSVEKVLVVDAEKLPFYPYLKAMGVKPEERLPFDCQMWFRISSSGIRS
jgi:hypothetical protein